MPVSVSRSLAYVEQGRSTCNVSRSRSVELFCFAAWVCHVCLFRFLARSLTPNKDDRPAMSVALIPLSFFVSQRASVMYVCCGFSLARLRRARTNDLQCESLSLHRVFLLRSVCQSGRLTVESYAVRWPTRARNQSKIIAEIARKSIPGDASGHPKSTQNRSQDPLGTHRGVQERPEGVSGASWERLGASPARPGSAQGVPKGAPERQKGRPGALGSALRRPKSTPSRVRERKNRVFLARRVREASSERFFVDFLRFLVFL